ncbi:hypothetical protein G4B88_007096 [Cannabis sativa]|uniref:Uncharacterized protein n=1 Tax=Cannabis sativa TaxID=3483 RepID=A0A7J6GPU3_CANSA|nr:hypothetical protein G4B88_007096 [Cannabis sativa]
MDYNDIIRQNDHSIENDNNYINAQKVINLPRRDSQEKWLAGWLRNTKPNTQNNQNRTKESKTQVSAFPQDHAEYGGGGECGGVGDGHGQRDWGVTQNRKESGGGREVDEEGNDVLPDGEELDPVAD